MHIRIVDHKGAYNDAFKSLNKHWIDKYFVMEPQDHHALDNPDEYIIDKGGSIKYALHNDIPVGVCALIKCKEGPYDYELAKMGVAEDFQAKGIGRKLAYEIIAEAKARGAKTIFLESNRKLEPAIKLYRCLLYTSPSPRDRG